MNQHKAQGSATRRRQIQATREDARCIPEALLWKDQLSEQGSASSIAWCEGFPWGVPCEGIETVVVPQPSSGLKETAEQG